MEEIKKVMEKLKERYKNTPAEMRLEFAEKYMGYIEKVAGKCYYDVLLNDLDFFILGVNSAYDYLSEDDRDKIFSVKIKLLDYIAEALVKHCGCKKV